MRRLRLRAGRIDTLAAERNSAATLGDLEMALPAPQPTGYGIWEQTRLSPQFSEWLMGLPAGFVTDLDLPYSAQLRILGNGVVPQQATKALRLLVHTAVSGGATRAVEQ